jgi:hypothetical protein
MRLKFKLLAAVLSGGLFCTIVFLLFTSQGSNFVVRKVLSHYAGVDEIDLFRSKGSLFTGLEWEGATVRNCRKLPPGFTVQVGKVLFRRSSLIRFSVELTDVVLSLKSQPGRLILMQTVKIVLGKAQLKDLNAFVEGGRTRFLKTDSILFHGSYVNGIVDSNFFTKWVDVNALLTFLNIGKLKAIEGSIIDADINIKGPLSALDVSGELTIENLTRSGFFLRNAPISLALQVQGMLKEPSLFGTVTVKSGEAQGPRTALVQFQESKFIFNGALENLNLDLKGNSTIRDVKFDIGLTGTIQKPIMSLKSKPSFPQDRLLVMLLTNKRLAAVQASAKEDQLSADQVKDLIDYFVFDSKAGKLAQDLGISTSLILGKEKQAVGVTKTLTEKIDGSYSVERTQVDGGDPSMSRKLGAEYKVNDVVSIGVEREVKQSERTDSDQSDSGQPDVPDNKFLLKIKKEF